MKKLLLVMGLLSLSLLMDARYYKYEPVYDEPVYYEEEYGYEGYGPVSGSVKFAGDVAEGAATGAANIVSGVTRVL